MPCPVNEPEYTTAMARLVHRFAEYSIDAVAREFRRAGQLVELPPQVFDCLAYLIERHDRAVGRDELVAAVWGRSEVSDTLLGQTILRIRRELGDDGKDPHVLRTIPRFGYRWVAPVETSVAAAAPEPVAGEVARSPSAGTQTIANDVIAAPVDRAMPPVRRASSQHSRAWVFSAMAALMALSLAGAWLLARHAGRSDAGNDTAATPQTQESAGVMPAAVDPGAESSWMRLGVMDMVATRLRSSGVPTTPSESIIALLNAPAAAHGGSVRDIAGFRLTVSPRASRRGDAWQVALDADDGARHYAVEARSRDITEAARAATDRLLVAMGRQPPNTGGDASGDAEALKRIDAAILADDPATALALIAQAPAAQQTSADLQLRLAKIDFRGGRLDAARARLEPLLAGATAQTAPVLRGSILNGLGAIAIRSDHPQQAEQVFGEAIALLVGQHDPAQLGQAYLGRAGAAAELRHFESASSNYALARIAFRQANDALALLRVDANQGFVDLDQGRPAQALPQLAAAGDGFVRWGALNEAVFAYIGQIACRLAELDPAGALQAADAAAAIAQRIDNPSTRDSLAIARAKALAAVGRLREARDLLDRVRSADPSPDDATAAAAASPLAQIELDDDHASLALDLAAHAVATLRESAYANLRADAWSTQIRALVRLQNKSDANAQALAFADWAASVDHRRANVLARIAKADTSWRFGSGEQWRAEFDGAGALAREGGVPADIARVAAAYATALISAGDVDAAAVEVGRVSRWAERDFGCAVLEARLYAALGRDEARQTALARARSLAGERPIPPEATAVGISAHSVSTR